MKTALSQFDCLAEYEVSLDDKGAQVEYMDAYVTPEEIAAHIETTTEFPVECIEPE